MKPKKVRVIESILQNLTNGKVYPVVKWHGLLPEILRDDKEPVLLNSSKWEPVQEFNHGDPVLAWDNEDFKEKAHYLCPRLKKPNRHLVELENGYLSFGNIEHRKPQMTLQELADKADVNLDEVEIVD